MIAEEWCAIPNDAAVKAALLSDICGNPWRPVEPTEPIARLVFRANRKRWLTWNNGTIPRLAQAIYDNLRWNDLPILADALCEAGADENVDLVRHLKGQERCWQCFGGPPFEEYGPSHDRRVKKCAACRGTGWRPLRSIHVRGCWAVDLLLTKA